MIWCKARYHSAVSIISEKKFNKIKREKELSGLLLFLGVSVALVQLAIKLCIYSVLVVSILVFANGKGLHMTRSQIHCLGSGNFQFCVGSSRKTLH